MTSIHGAVLISCLPLTFGSHTLKLESLWALNDEVQNQRKERTVGEFIPAPR